MVRAVTAFTGRRSARNYPFHARIIAKHYFRNKIGEIRPAGAVLRRVVICENRELSKEKKDEKNYETNATNPQNALAGEAGKSLCLRGSARID
jgi:hypothetical protein